MSFIDFDFKSKTVAFSLNIHFIFLMERKMIEKRYL